MPVARKTIGAGVSTAVNPVELILSVRKKPVDGLINLPDEVAVIEYPYAPFVETESSCADIFITPFPKEPKLTNVEVASSPTPGLVTSPPVQLAFCVVILVPLARPVIVNVKDGSTVPCT